MRSVTCPVCQLPNALRWVRCGACGAELNTEGIVAAAGRLAGEKRSRADTGLALPPSAKAESAALSSAPDTQMAPLFVSLRDVEALPAPPAVVPAENLELVGDPSDAARPLSEDKRAARRAAVRRVLLRAQLAGVPTCTEVLVHDSDDAARGTLSGWLRSFGFTVHETSDLGDAWVRVAANPLAAVFVDIVFDDSDGGAGVELCKRVKLLSHRREVKAATLLVLVSRALSPIEQVAAHLAGFDDIVRKPVTRGAVARALDQHGVPLPTDARRL